MANKEGAGQVSGPFGDLGKKRIETTDKWREPVKLEQKFVFELLEPHAFFCFPGPSSRLSPEQDTMLALVHLSGRHLQLADRMLKSDPDAAWAKVRPSRDGCSRNDGCDSQPACLLCHPRSEPKVVLAALRQDVLSLQMAAQDLNHGIY